MSWTILVNNLPAPSYINQAAAFGSLRRTTRVILHGAGPATILVRVTNNSPGLGKSHFQCRVLGWLYVELSR